MSDFETVFAIEKYRDPCEDRVEIFHRPQRTVIVVADGAGGTGSGDIAAQSVVQNVQENIEHMHSGNDWAALLHQLDLQVSIGQSTAVIVDVRPYGIAGASVGDSQAWLVQDEDTVDLTAKQYRKPLIGSGQCQPIAFTSTVSKGRLLVATDGLFDYAKRQRIIDLVRQSEFHETARKCIELVRLPSGKLWDDVGVVVCRDKPAQRTRQKYVI